jgi:hypothetical protein
MVCQAFGILLSYYIFLETEKLFFLTYRPFVPRQLLEDPYQACPGLVQRVAGQVNG